MRCGEFMYARSFGSLQEALVENYGIAHDDRSELDERNIVFLGRYFICPRSILIPTILQFRIACSLATLTLTHGALKSLRMICAMCSARVSSREKCPSLSTVWRCCATSA